MPGEGQGESPLSSSLPSVLLPYLLQQRRDSVSNQSTTDRQVPPIAPLTREMETLSTNGSPQQNLSPASVSPTPTFSYTGNHGSPRFYPPYARPDLETSNQISFAGSGDPQVSGLRHTLGTLNVHGTGHRYNSPIYSDPIYHTSRPSTSYRTGQGYPLPQPPSREQFSRQGWTNWREGEPGQAPLTSSRSPVAVHQLARLNQQTDAFNGPIWPEEQPDGFSSNILTQAESSRYSLRAISSQRLYEPRSSHHSPTIQELPPPHALFPGSEVPSPAIYGSRHEEYGSAQDLTRSPVGQRTWPLEESASGTSPLISAKHEHDSSEARSIGTEEHDEEFKPAQRKKRRREPVNSTQKDERPKKTAVACNFCRGRKLKCDGERPRCGVCGKRGLECEYVQRPKRRGPGKANKSSRSKRGEQGGPGRITSPSRSIMEPEQESMAESAVISLENFTFRPPTEPQRPGSSM